MRAPGDYAEFVRERQSDLLRAAYLVSGNPDVGRSLLLDALVDLARHWRQVRREQPDAFLRRSLYEGALAARAGHPYDVAGSDATASGEMPGDLWEGDLAARRHDLMRALAGLTPLQRAVLVDRYLERRCEAETEEVLGLAPADQHAALAEALGHLARLVPVRVGVGAGDACGRDDEVWSLLELGGDAVVDDDLVDEAWAEAAVRRHRVARRAVLGALGAGAVGIGASVLAERVRTSEAGTGRTTGPELASTTVGGSRLVLAPRPGAEPSLLPYPGAAALGIPPRLGSGAPANTTWTDVPLEVPIGAVLLANTPAGLQVVLELPVGQPRRNRVVLLNPTDTLRPRSFLSNRTISSDRHRVVLPSAGGVVVVDSTDRSVTQVPVPDIGISTAGWALDDRTVVASSLISGWEVDPESGASRAVAVPVCPDCADLGDAGEDLEVLTFTDVGALSGSRRVRGPRMVPSGEGPSAANDAGWVAGEVFLGPEVQEATGRRNGLVVVPPGDPADPIVLAASAHRGDGHRLRALRWATPSTVLLESRSYEAGWRRRVLAWDVRSHFLWRVAEVEPSSPTSWFTGLYAI